MNRPRQGKLALFASFLHNIPGKKQVEVVENMFQNKQRLKPIDMKGSKVISLDHSLMTQSHLVIRMRPKVKHEGLEETHSLPILFRPQVVIYCIAQCSLLFWFQTSIISCFQIDPMTL